MFELEHSSNPQDGCAWMKEKASVPTVWVSKNPAKIMVWGP